MLKELEFLLQPKLYGHIIILIEAKLIGTVAQTGLAIIRQGLLSLVLTSSNSSDAGDEHQYW